MIILIDNYDSFTYNLVHFLGELGAETTVYRNDQISVDEVIEKSPRGIVISPGPGTPDKSGISLAMVKSAQTAGVPLFGVCLGHQAIGQAFGGKIVNAGSIMHGKVDSIEHGNTGVFADLPSPFQATRYHSLTIERASVPDELEVTAQTADGVIMGVKHREDPVFGVQFHPESIATEHGHQLLGNFLKTCGYNIPVIEAA